MALKGVIERETGWKIDEEERKVTERDSSSASDDGPSTSSLHTPDYHIHAVDLRSLPGASLHSSDTTSALTSYIETNLPTLLISECCLIYLSPIDATAVLSHFTSLFSSSPASSPSLGIIIYEPIRPHDPFGRTMVSNLTARGIHLQTLNSHATLSAQRKRLRNHGFDRETPGTVAGGGNGAADVDFIYTSWIDEREKDRVEGLEWMDELEEWRLLMRHYCVVWGWRDGFGEGKGEGGKEFEGWNELKGQDGDE